MPRGTRHQSDTITKDNYSALDAVQEAAASVATSDTPDEVNDGDYHTSNVHPNADYGDGQPAPAFDRYDFLADVAANATVAPKARRPRHVGDVHPAIAALVRSVDQSSHQGHVPFTDESREDDVRSQLSAAAAQFGRRTYACTWREGDVFKGLRFTVGVKREAATNGTGDVPADGDDS